MTEQQQEALATWAVVEIMGHQVTGGFVTAKYFGGLAFFHVAASEQSEEPFTLEHGTYLAGQWIPAGSIVRMHREKVDRLLGAPSIFSISPCDEDAARRSQPRRLEVIALAIPPQLSPPTPEEIEEAEDAEDMLEAEVDAALDRMGAEIDIPGTMANRLLKREGDRHV